MILFSVLGCSDPLSVRSVAFCQLLVAALKTSLRGMDSYFRVTVVFLSVLLHGRAVSYTAGILPACSVQQILKYSVCSVYSVFVPGIC